MDVAAILLAAGQSRRMGRSKPLLPLGDRPVIRHCLAALRGGVDRPLVVLGPGGEAIAEILAGEDVDIAWNRVNASEMADSIRIGLGRVPAQVTGVLVAQADFPLLQPATIADLVARHRKRPDRILLPCYKGRRGHPPLIPRRIIDEIYTEPTLREIIQRDAKRNERVEVDDAGILQDMDTPEDYRHVRNLYMLNARKNGRPEST